MQAPLLRTFRHDDFTVGDLVARKHASGTTCSLVLPARDEEATVGLVLASLAPAVDAGLVDELVVIDSLSSDRTAAVAAAAGAKVVRVSEVYPSLPAVAGKGEAMWRALLATTSDLVAYCDADVLDAGAHYAIGLLGPMLVEPAVCLVKGFYRRPIVGAAGDIEEFGGRVTELTARPLLNVYRPELARLVQPLAGEWAGRRSLLESLAFPVGYGVEIAVLLDTHAALGLDGMAQVDLGSRTHRRQSQQALVVMAAQVLAAAGRRLGLEPRGASVRQYDVDDHTPIDTPIDLAERPPVASLRPR